MEKSVSSFISELKVVLSSFPDYSFAPLAGATAAEITSLEQSLSINFDVALRDLWMFSNGSKRTSWFGVITDENTACEFLSIKSALALWKEWNGLGEKWGGQGMPDREKRDRRIMSDWQLKWFPFAEFNGGSTMILFDAAPSPTGRYGQIIVYQHDPDGVYYVAESTAEFLKMSLPILKECLDELRDI